MPKPLTDTEARADLSATLAAGSHDLRGPVHHIQAYARLLRDDGRSMDAQQQGFVVERLLAAADTVSAQFNSMALWAKAEQGHLALLTTEDEPLLLLLEEFAGTGVLSLATDRALDVDVPSPAMLLRMVLAQLSAWAKESGVVLPLAVGLAREAGTGAPCWTLCWCGLAPAHEGAGAALARHGKGAAGRAELHLGALRALALAIGGLIEERAGLSGQRDYRVTLPLY